MGTYTVTDEPRKVKDLPATEKRGALTVWKVSLEGEGEVDLLRKPNNPPPGKGVQVLGEVTQNDYGKKLTLANEGRQGGGGGGKSPEQQKSIVRQHSQEMALRYLEAKGVRDFSLNDDFRTLVDWFEKDATP